MTDETIRKAQCSCGQFSVTVRGDPEWVNLCNCHDCQRRTGSAFQIAGFFRESQIIENTGERTEFHRPTQEGRTMDLEFCPVCGVSVLFRLKLRPGMMAIHAGCFADTGFPAPDRIWFAHRAHPWVVLPPGKNMTPAPD
ncbi:GFA family protein [Cucumibacter marinus]|uniref:GFA family protein n=1 Tax=Cucumibacter marinus TaxID=1121252 RepID=UPI00138AE85B|nr:GFA family protein [Cucumibacter marinus]